MLEIKITVKTYIFSLFALKTDNSLFCHRDIPTTLYRYITATALVMQSIMQRKTMFYHCVSNAVDYAKKNYVLPTILSTELRGHFSNNRFLH